MKNKFPTLYVYTFHEKHKHQMFSIKKLKLLKSILPTLDELKIHLLLEKKLVKENKNYIPQPYIITLNQNKFNDILNELKGKIGNYNINNIKLVASSNFVSIIEIRKNNSIN